MKISKSQLIEMIKEEMVKESGEFVPTGQLQPQSIGLTVKGVADGTAVKEILSNALAEWQSDPDPDSVYDLVGAIRAALKMLETAEPSEEETIEISEERKAQKYEPGARVEHRDHPEWRVGTVSAVGPGKEGTVSVRWSDGSRSHHRWALKPAK